MDILTAVLIGVLSASIFLIGIGCCLVMASAMIKILLQDD